ncbi:lysozyme inhibitor LprI family protein [Aliivibrio fischeri]
MCFTKKFYDQVYCSTKVYGLVDSALNKQYNKTIKRLTSNQVKQLKKVQISWIRSRDDKCAKVDNDGLFS